MEPSDALDLLAQRLHRISVQQYHAMIDAGAFEEDDNCELIHGVLIARARQSEPHAWVIQRLNGLLVRDVGEGFDVRVQLPLTLTEDSEPEPDFAVVPYLGYRQAEPSHPTTAHLVIEVSRSSLRFDRKIKGPLYARAAIPEYWIIDVAGRCIEVLRAPDAKRGIYTDVRTLEAREELSPVALPGPKFRLADVLP